MENLKLRFWPGTTGAMEGFRVRDTTRSENGKELSGTGVGRGMEGR